MSNIRPKLVSLGAALTALVGVTTSELFVRDAAAKPKVRESDGDEALQPLMLHTPAGDGARFAGHRSHSSHSSHASGSGGGYGGGSSGSGDNAAPVWTPPPPPPKPATVSFAVYPGGRIFVNDQPQGRDATGTLWLPPGKHKIRVENRFLGDHTEDVTLAEGQTGIVVVRW